MGKKTRHAMYTKSDKSKVMKMQEDSHDMEDMCDIDDMEEDMEEDMESSKSCCMGTMNDMENDMEDMCDAFPECIQLAHSYVPWQTYEKAFTPPEALMKGTLFPELWGVYRIPK
ncbi:spore coat associated protein CotJA [Sporomusa acidovorans]|uniref:Spore coat associated protein JA (CotJA) n=1 Tax=Sporomusa acidovorans (strain ATCC 49682 / DSM 3132 / Mol) TaxID=1123286 RepID=A0ABZ3JBI3_SPOA4|nr:spore coat associated protein CotJA [Sporomusa acidovorans]OZC13290.1 spore coat associated protein CotJA [Sporomusa acidovorans DSM 3132]SDD98103.1 Spore coat associated protein JA (CotJA) [Sporomusa acidovorans]